MSERLSVSGANRYLSCPHSWYMRYRSGVDTPGDFETPSHWRRGSAMHAALQAVLEAAQQSTSWAAGQKLAVHHEVARAALGVAWEGEGLPFTYGDWDNTLGAVLATLEALPAPAPADILGVEWQIELLTPAGTSIIVILDLLLAHGDGLRIVDWKSKFKPLDRDVIANDFQLNTYAAAAAVHYPERRPLQIGHYYPMIQSGVFVTANPTSMAEAFERLDTVAEMIDLDTDFEPKKSQACQTCPWRKDHCPAWADTSNDAYALIKDF